jgi:hypothetical protein
MNAPFTIDVDRLDRALEAGVLLRASERGHARDYRPGPAFGADEDQRCLEAFTLGILDALAWNLNPHPDTLPLLAYLLALHDYGPGEQTRAAQKWMLELRHVPELIPYVAGGRRLVLRIRNGGPSEPGIFAELLEEDVRRR